MMKLVGAIQRTHETNRRLQYDNIPVSEMIGFPEVMNGGNAEVEIQFIVAKKGSISRYVFVIDRLVCPNKADSLAALT